MKNLALTPEQVVEWETRGFVTIPNALSDAECDELFDAVTRRAEPQLATGPALASEMATFKQDQCFRDVMDHRALLPVAIDLLGEHIRMMSTQWLVRMPAGAEDTRVWHPDGPIYPYPAVRGVTPLLQLKANIALHDQSSGEYGNTNVIPGSHHVDHATMQAAIAKCGNDLPTAVEWAPNKGDAIFFHQGVWHTNGNNRSDGPRVNLFYAWCHQWMSPYDYADADLTPDVLALMNPVQRRLLTGPENDYAWRLFGHGEREVAGATLLELLAAQSATPEPTTTTTPEIDS